MEAESIKTFDMQMGVIGGGNMAKAICEGLVNKGLISYSKFNVSGPRLINLNEWKDKGANITNENGKVVEKSDVIFLAVKPQFLSEAISSMYNTLDRKKIKSKLFISVLAGVTIEHLEELLNELEEPRVVRVMPNTPLLVGQGCSVFCPGRKATNDDIALVQKIFEVSGICYQVPESLINPVGGLSGSGPAYVYLMIEALADGGVKVGIPRAMALKLAAQTVLGAASMVLNTGKHPGILKDEVCSPGGTTITGIHALEKGSVRSAFISAVEASALKSAELGQKKK